MVPGFEWDIEKADSNFKKHGVRFSQAVTALEDAYALTIEDFHAGEQRFVTLGRMEDMKREYDFSQGKRGAVIPLPPGKERITIRLDADILDWFRQQAEAQGGGNYQTMINQALRQFIGTHQVDHIEDIVRRVVQEEIAKYQSSKP